MSNELLISIFSAVVGCVFIYKAIEHEDGMYFFAGIIFLMIFFFQWGAYDGK